MSFAWLIFTGVFSCFAIEQYRLSEEAIPEIPVQTFQVDIGLGSVGIGQSISDFETHFNEYVRAQNETSKENAELAMWGFIVGAITSLVSMILEMNQTTEK